MKLLTWALGAFIALLAHQTAVLAFKSDDPICDNLACKFIGDHLSKSINASIDPCEDFYEHVCGNWIVNNPLGLNSHLSKSSQFSDHIKHQLYAVINESLLVREENPNAFRSRAMNFGLDMFVDCMDHSLKKSLRDKPLRDLIKETLGFRWPLIDVIDFKYIEVKGKSKLQVFQGSWHQMYQIGVAPIFSFKILPDARTNISNLFVFEVPEFTLEYEYCEDPEKYAEQLTRHKKKWRTIGTVMANERLIVGRRHQFDLRMKELLEFETRLVLLASQQEKKSANEYHTMNLDEFEALTDRSFRWTNHINEIFEMHDFDGHVDTNTIILVQNLEYYKNLSQIINDVPDYVLHNYAGLMILNYYYQYTEGSVKQLIQPYTDQNLLSECFTEIFGNIPFPFARMFVDKYAVEKAKPVMKVMTENMKEALRLTILLIQWLDFGSQYRVMNKFRKLQERLNYPDWLANNTKLDEYYYLNEKDADRYPKGQYLMGIASLHRNMMRRTFKRFGQYVDFEFEWPTSPVSVYTKYSVTKNIIVVPSAALFLPFFHPELPPYINYGTIGSTMGHEMLHGFDQEGAKYDEFGNLNHLWSEAALIGFSKRSDCFIKQYSDIVEPKTNKSLNGRNTLRENIAETGGVWLAYRAYRRHIMNHKDVSVISKLSRYTTSQLFFISYASMYCSASTSYHIGEQIDSDIYPPDKYRVNVALQNMKEFTEAFECEPNKHMNPNNRCFIWYH